jgi:hypothetical protein
LLEKRTLQTSHHMTRSGKIHPAISKKLAGEIREIANRARNEEEIRLSAEQLLEVSQPAAQ